ncbi:MAG: response regulator transcription factor [Dysgonamonadaceae bacterium]|jgi:DNA-binding NarL/FixJ family response regulator|nr:response regulator transcription factor [Dysgonamonadaceae bacterium]
MISVHIVDDHKMLVEGISKVINESGVATVTHISYTITECKASLEKALPDILLLDLSLPDGNGIDFCSEIRRKYPQLRILILTTHDEYSIARRVLNNGASGYILKKSLSKEVIEGIETVMRGEIFLCETIDILMKKRTDEPVWLTLREQDILRYIIDGYTNQEIAEKIFLSVETIKTYRKNLIFKLGARNSMTLVKMALENKLV